MSVTVGGETAPDAGVILGQNLMRQSLADGNLSPFDRAMTYMQACTDEQRRADVWKGVRFGLAGLAIDGWSEHITEPLPEPVPFGSGTIGYRFTDASGIDVGPVTRARTSELTGQWVTHGQSAMSNLAASLRRSFTAFLESSHAVGPIPMPRIVDALATYVKLGVSLGLGDTPERFAYGDARYHLYRGVQTKTGVIGRLGTAGGNVMRFSNPATVAAMQYGATGESIIDPDDPPVKKPKTELPTRALLEDLLMEAAAFALHASQRRDGLEMVLSEGLPILPNFQIGVSSHGRPEVGWEGKHKPRIAQHESGTIPPVDRVVGVTARQKCPIGYSADAFSDMFGEKLVDATMYNFRQRGLTDPAVFLGIKYTYMPRWQQAVVDVINHHIDTLRLYAKPRVPKFMRRLLRLPR